MPNTYGKDMKQYARQRAKLPPAAISRVFYNCEMPVGRMGKKFLGYGRRTVLTSSPGVVVAQ